MTKDYNNMYRFADEEIYELQMDILNCSVKKINEQIYKLEEKRKNLQKTINGYKSRLSILKQKKSKLR